MRDEDDREIDRLREHYVKERANNKHALAKITETYVATGCKWMHSTDTSCTCAAGRLYAVCLAELGGGEGE